MKKLFLVDMIVCLFNIAAFAGWADSMRQPCDPATSKPNTCFYYPDGVPRSISQTAADDSMLTYIENIISGFNPFDYFLD